MSLLEIPSTSTPSNRIFLGNLGYSIDEHTLRRYCGEWGELNECRLMCDPKNDGKTRGFAFISYKYLNSATKFLGACPHYIGDRRINVKSCISENNSESKFGDPLLPTKLLFVSFSGTQLGANKFYLEEYFAKFGLINELTFHISKNTTNNSNFHVGFAILQFLNYSSAIKCLQETENHSIKNFSNIRIRRLISSEGLLKRKRELVIEDELAQQQQENSEDFSNSIPTKRPSLLATKSYKSNSTISNSVKEYVAAPIKFTSSSTMSTKSLAGYGYQ